MTQAQVGCNGKCCPIYRGGQLIGHIKKREEQQEILGTQGQFCAAFYHVHEWENHHYHCLDNANCEIGIRGNFQNQNNVQPKQVIAVVRCEDAQGHTLYEARYSNCRVPAAIMHAEDFFRNDVINGELANILQEQNGGKITMYQTYQPCNKSVGTAATPADKTCCVTLTNIFNDILSPRNISLCIKVTHLYRVSFQREIADNEILRQRAIQGVQDLKQINNVRVKHMTKKDWNYLSGLTAADVTQGNKQRKNLDKSIQGILTQIQPTQQPLSVNT